MKQYINFNYSNVSNYSLQHHFGKLFKKVELIFFILLSLVFLAASKNNEKFSRNLSFVFVDISLPIVKVAAFPFNVVINLLTNFQELVEAKEQNIALKEENQKMRALYAKAINVQNENQKIKELIQFVAPKSTEYLLAKVSGRSHGAFNQNIFLEAGLSRNVKEGSVIVGDVAMIGRVTDIEDNRSRIILVTDATSHIPIIASESKAKGILIGTNKNLMEILYLSHNHQIKAGEMIFTSGDGDTLPAGILIGVVKKVDKMYVGVEMIEDINNTDTVAIIQL